MMKYLLIVVAVLMAACNIPPASFKPDPSPIDVARDEILKVEVVKMPEVKPDPKPEPQPKAVIKVPSCKGIDTGDEKETINLKFDCMLDGK